MNLLDPIGASLSLISTYYFTQARRFAWVFGLFAILINSILYWQKGIYGHVLLEIIYFISMIYGWLSWSDPSRAHNTLPIRYLSGSEIRIYGLILLIGMGLLAQALQLFSDSTIPYWDASTTVLSLLAQWLLCRKIIHCWILWFVVDAMVAAIQLYKGIPFHSALHFLYLGLAVIGYVRWKRLLLGTGLTPAMRVGA